MHLQPVLTVRKFFLILIPNVLACDLPVELCSLKATDCSYTAGQQSLVSSGQKFESTSSLCRLCLPGVVFLASLSFSSFGHKMETLER